MPFDLLTSQKAHFLGLQAGEFDALVQTWGWPAFRAQQVRDWVYGKRLSDPQQMLNLSKADRATLADRITFTPSQVAAQQNSADATLKLLLNWDPLTGSGGNAETVMI